MGKVHKMLDELESQLKRQSVEENKETIFVLAYACRVSILDRIEANPWMRGNTPIKIPLGLIRYRSETLESGLQITVGKIDDIASSDYEVYNAVQDIFSKGPTFYQLQALLPPEYLQKL
ncbi:MAG: hypothetical protein J6T86_00340 [Bacteroidales bacterium]|nr:hypothetical protein [Bacteroidales bacterium]